MSVAISRTRSSAGKDGLEVVDHAILDIHRARTCGLERAERDPRRPRGPGASAEGDLPVRRPNAAGEGPTRTATATVQKVFNIFLSKTVGIIGDALHLQECHPSASGGEITEKHF